MNNNDLILKNDVTFYSYPTGSPNSIGSYALSLDGEDDYAIAGRHSSSLQPQTDLTISVWVNFKNLASQTIVAKGDGITSGYALSINDDSASLNCEGKICLAVYNESEPVVIAAPSTGVNVNSWHHISAIFDGGDAGTGQRKGHIYLDGIELTDSSPDTFNYGEIIGPGDHSAALAPNLVETHVAVITFLDTWIN